MACANPRATSAKLIRYTGHLLPVRGIQHHQSN